MEEDRGRFLRINAALRVPLRELRFEFARSSGAGGQNVNKVSSKARLRWSPGRSRSLPRDVRDRFRERYRRRITREGEFVLSSQRFRDQGRNVEDCLERLRAMLLEVATPPRPRVATRPGRAQRERRLHDKRRRSETKAGRRRVTRRVDD